MDIKSWYFEELENMEKVIEKLVKYGEENEAQIKRQDEQIANLTKRLEERPIGESYKNVETESKGKNDGSKSIVKSKPRKSRKPHGDSNLKLLNTNLT